MTEPKVTLAPHRAWSEGGERWKIKDEQGHKVGEIGTTPKRWGQIRRFEHEQGLPRFASGAVGDQLTYPNQRNKGYATAARIERAKQTKYKKIYVSIRDDNIGSIKAAEKSGAKKIRSVPEGTKNATTDRTVYVYQKNAFGIVHKRRPSEARKKAIAQQDSFLNDLQSGITDHHKAYRFPKKLDDQQNATLKSRKKVYGYQVDRGWGIHDDTPDVYPAKQFYYTAVKPGADPRRREVSKKHV